MKKLELIVTTGVLSVLSACGDNPPPPQPPPPPTPPPTHHNSAPPPTHHNSALELYYPVESTYTTSAIASVSGEGTTASWWGAGQRYFIEMAATSTIQSSVLSNDGTKAQFEMSVVEARAAKMTSKKKLRFTLNTEAVKLVDRLLIYAIPLNPKVLWAKSVITALKKYEDFDPGFEGLLGILFDPTEIDYTGETEIEEDVIDGVLVKSKKFIEVIDGLRFRYWYDADQESITVDREDIWSLRTQDKTSRDVAEIIEQVERFHTTLTAHFLYPHTLVGDEKIGTNVGDAWDVDASKIASLMQIGGSADISGTVTVKREKGAGNKIRLRVVGGRVEYRTDSSDNRVQAIASPRAGTITLMPIPNSSGGYYVEQATITASARFEATADDFIFEEKMAGNPVITFEFRGAWN